MLVRFRVFSSDKKKRNESQDALPPVSRKDQGLGIYGSDRDDRNRKLAYFTYLGGRNQPI